MRAIKRWQWIAISLVLGLLIGYVQRMPESDWAKAFGDTITQRQFEEGLLRQQNGLPWFCNIVVYPERIEVAGKGRPIYIVCGDYFNGRLEARNGQQVAVWRPRCYIAEVPYQPAGKPERDAASGTVMGFLDGLRSKGVVYTYAWWRDPEWAIGIWTGGSILLIGLILPTLINLFAFGSALRPAEEKADLSGIRTMPAPEPAMPGDFSEVEKIGEEIAAELSDAPAASTPVPPSISGPEPVRDLSATAVELAAEEKARQEREFGKEKDDFYPTERHHAHQ